MEESARLYARSVALAIARDKLAALAAVALIG
jgi:hypothetical protein